MGPDDNVCRKVTFRKHLHHAIPHRYRYRTRITRSSRWVSPTTSYLSEYPCQDQPREECLGRPFDPHPHSCGEKTSSLFENLSKHGLQPCTDDPKVFEVSSHDTKDWSAASSTNVSARSRTCSKSTRENLAILPIYKKQRPLWTRWRCSAIFSSQAR